MKTIEEITNKFICGHNVDVLKEFPDNLVDLVVTSPPYNTLRKYKGFNFDFPGIAEQLTRVLKLGGVIVWVVGDSVVDSSETLEPFKQAIYFKEVCKLNLFDTMIWEKHYIKFPETVRYHQAFEYMFVFSKGKPSVFNPLKDKPNVYTGQKVHGKNRTGDDMFVENAGKGKVIKPFGMRTNVWVYHNETGTKYFIGTESVKHPAVFPFQLAEDHIKSWSNPGDFVLDPFGGRGSVARMAKANNRKFIYVDISQEFTDMAKRLCGNVGLWND